MFARFGVFLSAALTCLSALAADPILLTPLEVWNGSVAESDRRAAAPENHLIASADSFDKLWKSWRGEQALPKVDFTSEVVVVGEAAGPNRVYLKPWLASDGNLSVSVMATKLPGPGFGYSIWRIKRGNIRSVDGTPLPK